MSDWFARPILCVAEVQRSLNFYIDKLGFKEAWRFVEEGRLLCAQVDRQGCSLILSCQWPANNGKGLIFISLDPGVLDTVRVEYESKGVNVKDGEWGYKLMAVEDLDGNELMFNYPSEAT